MRKTIAVLVCFLATSAFAQSNTLSVFISNPGGGYSQGSGTVLNGGIGLEYQRQVTPRWSVAGSAAREQYRFLARTADGTFVKTDGHVTPVDVVARYRFFNSARWRPYAGFGLRFVAPPLSGYGISNRITPELNAGLVFQVNRRFGIYGDIKQGLRNETGPRYDPLTKTSFGLRFGF